MGAVAALPEVVATVEGRLAAGMVEEGMVAGVALQVAPYIQASAVVETAGEIAAGAVMVAGRLVLA